MSINRILRVKKCGIYGVNVNYGKDVSLVVPGEHLGVVTFTGIGLKMKKKKKSESEGRVQRWKRELWRCTYATACRDRCVPLITSFGSQ